MPQPPPKGFLKQLQRIVGPAHVSAGRTDAEVYSYDASTVVGAPDAIVFPASTAETAAVVRATAAAGVPVIPRGFGTNLSGGSVAPRGGVVVCFVRMNRVLAIQPERQCAVVQPGLTNLELQNALAPLGFFYAPDPASQKVATMGGNVGENSGGPHCVKYGVTVNHILGMEVVLAGGEVLRIGGPALDPPGYDLRGPLVGSEGTFGLVTEITVRILPRPESVAMLLAIYDDVADAARSVSGIIAAGIVPATLEMMDAAVMRAVEESIPCGYPMDAAAVLIIEVEGLAAGLGPQAESIERICMENRCRTVRRARDAAERDRLWAGRRGAFGAIARIAPNFFVADCTVPRTLLPEALARVADIARRHRLKQANVFHAGDGNLHPLLFFDSRDPDEVRRVHEAGHEVILACVGLGGTITGEHGVGIEKLEPMRLIFSEDDLAFQRAVRSAFDPRDVINPGKVIPPPASPSLSPWERGGVRDALSAADAQERVPESDAPHPDPLPKGEGTLTPVDEAEACEMVRTAITEQVALLPIGGGRRADFGNLSPRELTALRSEKLSAVIEYDPGTQVITVGAGMKLAALQEVLAAHNQWLPLRPPLADACTVGGIVALGACGPERLRYGAPRDLLLGLRFVSGAGKRIAAGGKVVKNVAGYDVTRLMAGSAGTLGFLAALTFRVVLRPEACRAVCARGSLDACAAAASEILRSSLEPVFVTAMPEDAAGRAGDPDSAASPSPSSLWQFQVGFEGLDATVRIQTERCGAILSKAGLGSPHESEYPVCTGEPGLAASSPAPADDRLVSGGVHAEPYRLLFAPDFLLRADLCPDLVTGFVSEGSAFFGAARVLVDFGCGRVMAGMAELSDEAWAGLCALAGRAGGHAVLEKAPADFKRGHDVFGPPRPEWALTHRLKAALDPANVFAPGRLPGRR